MQNFPNLRRSASCLEDVSSPTLVSVSRSSSRAACCNSYRWCVRKHKIKLSNHDGRSQFRKMPPKKFNRLVNFDTLSCFHQFSESRGNIVFSFICQARQKSQTPCSHRDVELIGFPDTVGSVVHWHQALMEHPAPLSLKSLTMKI